MHLEFVTNWSDFWWVIYHWLENVFTAVCGVIENKQVVFLKKKKKMKNTLWLKHFQKFNFLCSFIKGVQFRSQNLSFWK